MTEINEAITPKMKGHVKIFDVTDKNNKLLLVDEDNSIHFENMSLALAESLARYNVSGVYVGPINTMVFGNGGTSVDQTGVITYLPKNVTGQTATLYNQTYSKIVDQNNPLNINVSENYMNVSHVSGNLFSDILVICTLGFGEPSGQQTLDTTSTLNDQYVFDELGLLNYDGKLLCHICFSPVQKSNNRLFEIQYSLRIALV